MKPLIKKFIKKLLSLMGLRISLIGTGILSDKSWLILSEKDRFKWIQDMNIRTVLDVGANIGQSALEFHRIFPEARIYSFEPLRDCFLQMNSAMRNVPNFRSFNFALGEKKGKENIYRSSYSQSSSLRRMGELHKKAFPKSAVETLETIEINTLDNVAQELDLEDNILLKIDVQGFEDKVIKGAENFLNRVKVIIIETSFLELYEGQPLFSDIYEILSQHGFAYSGNWGEGELLNRSDGTHLAQDSIFIAN